MVWLKEIYLKKEKKLRKRGEEREREVPTTAHHSEGGKGTFSKSSDTNSCSPPPAANI